MCFELRDMKHEDLINTYNVKKLSTGDTLEAIIDACIFYLVNSYLNENS